MAHQLIDNFSFKGQKFLDDRQFQQSLSNLASWDFARTPIPDGFRVYCAETKLWYIYNSSNTQVAATGLFREENEEISANVETLILQVQDLVVRTIILESFRTQTDQQLKNITTSLTTISVNLSDVTTRMASAEAQIQALASNYRSQQQQISSLQSTKVGFKGYFLTITALQDQYPIAYDGDFAYVKSGTTQGQFTVYRFNGSIQAWESNGVDMVPDTPVIQGLQPESDMPIINASLYDGGLVTETVTSFESFQAFLMAEAQSTPVLPTSIRKNGMIITVLIAPTGGPAYWTTRQFIGTSISQWTTASNWVLYPPEGIFSADPI